MTRGGVGSVWFSSRIDRRGSWSGSSSGGGHWDLIIRTVRSSSDEWEGWWRRAIMGYIWSLRSSSDGSSEGDVYPSQRATEIGRLKTCGGFLRDCGLIAMRSWLIHRRIRSHDSSNWWCTIVVRSWPSLPPIHRIKRPWFSGEKNPL